MSLWNLTNETWAWFLCLFTSTLLLLAFLIMFIRGIFTPTTKVKGKADHRNLQCLRLSLIFAMLCQCCYPIPFLMHELAPHDRDYPTLLIGVISSMYDIVLSTILLVIVIRIFNGYRALFYPQFGGGPSKKKDIQSVDMIKSKVPFYYLFPTFIWCLSSYCLAIITFLHLTFNRSHLINEIFNIYAAAWAVLEALFLIQLLFVLYRLRNLLRSQYSYKKNLEIGIVDRNGKATLGVDRDDRYKRMMENMLRRMKRLIFGFAVYFLIIEASYIWMVFDDFDRYNKPLWILIHNTLGHLAIHLTLLYYVRIRDYNKYDKVQEKEEGMRIKEENGDLLENQQSIETMQGQMGKPLLAGSVANRTMSMTSKDAAPSWMQFVDKYKLPPNSS